MLKYIKQAVIGTFLIAAIAYGSGAMSFSGVSNFVTATIGTLTVTTVTGTTGNFTTLNANFEDAGTIMSNALITSSKTSGTAMSLPQGASFAFGNAALSSSASAFLVQGALPLTPNTDEAINLGSTTVRWSNIYVGPGSQVITYRAKGTEASGTGITASYTAAVGHWVHKVIVSETALAAAGTSDVTLHVTPVNSRIIRVLDEVTAVFDDGAGPMSAVTVVCGKTAGGNEYLLSHSVLAATGAFGDVVAEMGAGVVSATLADMGTVATGVPGAITVQCRFTCTGATCDAATTGSSTFYVEGVTY